MLVYLTDLQQTPNWSKEETTLEKIFHYGVMGYGGIRSLKQFGLYKDESRDIRHNVYHPIDYVSHDVRIIVGEFDCLEKSKPDNSHVVKELDRDRDISILKVSFPTIKDGDKEYRNNEYTNKVFEKLKQDKRILFCYITPSGKGLRFGFKLDERVLQGAFTSFAILLVCTGSCLTRTSGTLRILQNLRNYNGLRIYRRLVF